MPSDSQPPTSGTTGASVTHFRWDSITPATRDWLRGRTDDIIAWAYRSACDAFRIGKALEEVKERLAHGEYEAWIADVLPFSLKTAHRYRQVARAFGPYEKCQFDAFDPSALYILAQHSTPDAARQHAISLAEEGKRVTHADALEILDAFKDIPVTREMLSAASTAHKRLKDLQEQEKEAQKEREQENNKEYGKEYPVEKRAAWWDTFAALVDKSTTVQVAKVDDPEDDTLYTVTCHIPDDCPRNAVRRSLSDAIAGITGEEDEKRCPGCRKWKAVSLFSDNLSKGDDRNDYCKVCERKRRKKMRRKRRLAREAEQKAQRKAQREAKKRRREVGDQAA